MKWNIDYEVATIIFQLIFMVYFFLRGYLPTRANRLFSVCIVASFVVSVMDVIAAVVNSYSGMLSLSFLYFLNALYYLLVPVFALALFLYMLCITGQYSVIKSGFFAVLIVPTLVYLCLALTSSLTGFIYYLDREGVYHHGKFYIIEFVVKVFYLIISLGYLVAFRNYVTLIQRLSIYIFSGIIFASNVLQFFWFGNVLIANASAQMAVIMMYMSMQNPDMYMDKSSGLYNTDAFDELTTEYLADGKNFSCIFFSINDFDNLDSMYGHDNVNKCMQEIVQYLSKVFSDNWVYRMDSGSFMIQQSDKGDFHEVSRAVLNRFSKPFCYDDVQMNIGVSIIVIPYFHMPRQLAKINSIITFARKKRNIWKGAVLEIDDSFIDRMEHERAVEIAVDNAIRNNSIRVYYQPIYSTETGKIVACEALARLFDDEIGYISPDEFINKAEENGSIAKLGLQIYEKICLFIKENTPEKYGLESVHVNISPIQCRQGRLAQDLIELTNKYEISRRMINLEITETASIEQNSHVVNTMESLIAASFTFSLDDYGTGFSNTPMIIQLPFSYVKIDKVLLWSYFNKRSPVLPDLINMFHNQKLKIVAEGVETQEMVNKLKEFGCENLQGFFFSKPLPHREFMAYMRNFNKI